MLHARNGKSAKYYLSSRRALDVVVIPERVRRRLHQTTLQAKIRHDGVERITRLGGMLPRNHLPNARNRRRLPGMDAIVG